MAYLGLIGGKAKRQELMQVGLFQVHHKLPFFGIKPLEIVSKDGGHFFPDRKQAFIDTGSHVGPTIRANTAKFCGHSLQRLADQARYRTAPTRVDGGHDPVLLVKNQDRGAIGHRNGQQDTGLIGDQSIETLELAWAIDPQNMVTMYLTRHSQLFRLEAQSRTKPAAVFEHVRGVIVCAFPQIQRLIRAQANAAVAGAFGSHDGRKASKNGRFIEREQGGNSN